MKNCISWILYGLVMSGACGASADEMAPEQMAAKTIVIGTHTPLGHWTPDEGHGQVVNRILLTNDQEHLNVLCAHAASDEAFAKVVQIASAVPDTYIASNPTARLMCSVTPSLKNLAWWAVK